MARAAAGADLGADHAVDHQRVPVAPRGQQLVDVDERRQEAERQVQDRLLAVEVDQERGQRGAERQAPLALGLQALVRLLVEERLEARARHVELLELRLALVLGEHAALLDRAAIRGQHAVDGLSIALPELITGQLQERRALQPALDEVEQRRRGERGLLRGALLVDARRVQSLDLYALLAAQPQLQLDQPELYALEARRRHQHVAEVQEVQRRHRLEDAQLV